MHTTDSAISPDAAYTHWVRGKDFAVAAAGALRPTGRTLNRWQAEAAGVNVVRLRCGPGLEQAICLYREIDIGCWYSLGLFTPRPDWETLLSPAD